MDFFTPVELPSGLPPLVQADSLLLMGSCFATNMGSLLADAKFHPDINPFGVLYNPLSISAALRHPEVFPVDINKADYEMLLRVPGIGVKSAKIIIVSRRYANLGSEQLKKIGVVMKKASYFITCRELPTQTVNEVSPETVRQLLTRKSGKKVDDRQLILPFID